MTRLVFSYFMKIISWLPSRLHAHHSIMDPSKVQRFFNETGSPTEAQIVELKDMLSKRTSPERLNRIMTFFNGFRYGANIDEISAALVNIKESSICI